MNFHQNYSQKNQLTEIEFDFVDFISTKTGIDQELIESKYLTIKEELKCNTFEYKMMMDKVYRMNKLLYDYKIPKQQIESYKHHELMLVLRYLSYSYNKVESDLHSSFLDSPLKSIKNYLKEKLTNRSERSKQSSIDKKSLANTDFNINNWHKGLAFQYLKIAKYLASLIEQNPILIDYGSGLGYISFEIAKLFPKGKTYLVDIDTLVLEFSKYRFVKHGLNIETILIKSEDNMYPNLPFHNVCIATEVMEHIDNPMIVYNNINTSLSLDGILFGNFHDHATEEQHISCDLSCLREKLNTDFLKVNEMTWRKVN